MSMLLFPPERQSDNLAYLILPSSIVLLLHALKFISLENPATLGASIVGISAFGLFLYVFSPIDIFLRYQTRGRFQGKKLERLALAMQKWYEDSTNGTPPRKVYLELAERWISNAISSYAMRNRFMRIRVLYYFAISCGFYIFPLAVFFHSIPFTNQLIARSYAFIFWQVVGRPGLQWNWLTMEATADFILAIGQPIIYFTAAFSTSVVWIGLAEVYRGRRIYGSYLYRDVAYVAEYLVVELKTAGEYRTASEKRKEKKSEGNERMRIKGEEMRRFGNMLLRGDLDTFAIIWGNHWSKTKEK